MSRVRTKGTAAELFVRREFHAAGLRLRLHRKDLPGTPDIVLSRLKTAVFVNGCFWHGHSCSRGKLPASNREFWAHKIEKNRQRDSEALMKLQFLGWKTIIIWECRIALETATAVEALLALKNSL